LTFALETPSTFVNAFSTRRTHEAQVIPSMSRVNPASFAPGFGAFSIGVNSIVATVPHHDLSSPGILADTRYRYSKFDNTHRGYIGQVGKRQLLSVIRFRRP
jgi:hypothetical protein